MTELISYDSYLKPLGDLPKHITHVQYLRLRMLPGEHYNSIVLRNRMNKFLIDRDSLLLDFSFEVGGRIGDLCNVKQADFDFKNMILHLRVKKTKRVIKINLTQELCYQIMQFYNIYKKEPFEMSRVNAWLRIKKYGQMINLNLHPHMFRHGLAIFLLNNKVPIPIISYRLGHSNVKTTMAYYLKITPEMEKFFLENIDFRGVK